MCVPGKGLRLSHPAASTFAHELSHQPWPFLPLLCVLVLLLALWVPRTETELCLLTASRPSSSLSFLEVFLSSSAALSSSPPQDFFQAHIPVFLVLFWTVLPHPHGLTTSSAGSLLLSTLPPSVFSVLLSGSNLTPCPAPLVQDTRTRSLPLQLLL